MAHCIFCKIIEGEIPCHKVYEDDRTLAFHDINPKAPMHVVVIPKKHIANIMQASEDAQLLKDMACAVTEVAKALGVQDSGFRTVTNTGEGGGQSVDHFHFHVLAGKTFGEDFG
ncbi:MAG: histidine triad nucleotide-binding protein [Clostridiales bacterium]|nr:histidine triad nucleotide-binding protein [Clostridiales bacterium]